jgi:YVTN family beta-propeller protein
MTTDPGIPPQKDGYSSPGYTSSRETVLPFSDPPLEQLFAKARKEGRAIPDLTTVTESTTPIGPMSIRQIPVGEGPQFVTVSPDGARLYVTHLISGLVSMIDIARQQVIATERISEGLYGIAANPVRPQLHVADPGSQSLTLIEVSGDEMSSFGASHFHHSPYGVAVGAQGGPVYVALALEDAVMVTDPFGHQDPGDGFIRDVDFPVGLAVTQDGTRLYATNYFSKAVSVIDLGSMAVVEKIPVEQGPYGVAVNRDGDRLYVAHFPYDSVSVIDVDQGRAVEKIPLGGWPKGIALSQDETQLYVTTPKAQSVSVISL